MFISFTLILNISTQHSVILDRFHRWSWLQVLHCGYSNWYCCQDVLDADWIPQFQCKVQSLCKLVHSICAAHSPDTARHYSSWVTTVSEWNWYLKESMEVCIHPPYILCSVFQRWHSTFQQNMQSYLFQAIKFWQPYSKINADYFRVCDVLSLIIVLEY